MSDNNTRNFCSVLYENVYYGSQYNHLGMTESTSTHNMNRIEYFYLTYHGPFLAYITMKQNKYMWTCFYGDTTSYIKIVTKYLAYLFLSIMMKYTCNNSNLNWRTVSHRVDELISSYRTRHEALSVIRWCEHPSWYSMPDQVTTVIICLLSYNMKAVTKE